MTPPEGASGLPILRRGTRTSAAAFIRSWSCVTLRRSVARPLFESACGPPPITGAGNPTWPTAHHIRFSNGRYTIRLTTNAPLAALLEERVIVLEKPITLLLGPDESIPEGPDKVSREIYGETKAYWENWTRALSIPFEWQREVIRAAITLKLCTYEDTGAVLAALTTSIPEAPESGRNWDYRYCWLRDSYYTVQALNSLGATKTMQQFLSYIFNLVAEHGDSNHLHPSMGSRANRT